MHEMFANKLKAANLSNNLSLSKCMYMYILTETSETETSCL